MPDEKEDVPFKAEFGLSAKASVSVEGEVPSSSLGRLVDSLTDLIRPLSESRGLRADQLRLQREDVLIQIARKARVRIAEEQAVVLPIPIKTLVPLLERASLEEPGGELIDWWSALLSSTATCQGLQHPVFSEVLGRITTSEAKYLQRMVATFDADAVARGETDIQQLYIDVVYNPLDRLLNDISDGDYSPRAQEHLDKFRFALEMRANVVLSLSFPSGAFIFDRDTEETFVNDRSYRDILDVLQAVGVVRSTFKTFPVPSPYLSEVICSLDLISLTHMGRQILRACIPKR